MAAIYTIVWTPTGGAAVTLCDLSLGYRPVLEQLPSEALEQVDRLAFGTVVSRIMRANRSGDVVFTVGFSHASAAAAAAWYATIDALVGGMGQLVITINTTVWSFSNATFRAMAPTRINGVEWVLRYTFGRTVMDVPLDTDPSAPAPSPS
jgi:hypothetical protein